MAQEITVALSGTLIDDENWPANDVAVPISRRESTVLATAGATVELMSTDNCAGDEVRLVSTVTASLLGDGKTARISVLLRLFEGTNCQTDDPDGGDVTIVRNVAADGSTDFETSHPGDGGGSFRGRVFLRNTTV